MKNHFTFCSILLVSIVTFTGCYPEDVPSISQGEGIRDIDVAEAAKIIADDTSVVILDIRTSGEFTKGHIKDAVNIDYNAGDYTTKLEALDKSTTYIMHCQSGGRSGKSVATFEQLGFEKVLHLKAGFAGWKNAGHPVE